MTDDQPSQPLTDERLAEIRNHVEHQLMVDRSVNTIAVRNLAEAVDERAILLDEVDRLRTQSVRHVDCNAEAWAAAARVTRDLRAELDSMTQFAESLRADRDRSVRSCGELGVELDRLRAENAAVKTKCEGFQKMMNSAVSAGVVIDGERLDALREVEQLQSALTALGRNERAAANRALELQEENERLRLEAVQMESGAQIAMNAGVVALQEVQRLEIERDDLKLINDRMAEDRLRLVDERDRLITERDDLAARLDVREVINQTIGELQTELDQLRAEGGSADRGEMLSDLQWYISDMGLEHWQTCPMGAEDCYLCAGHVAIRDRWKGVE